MEGTRVIVHGLAYPKRFVQLECGIGIPIFFEAEIDLGQFVKRALFSVRKPACGEQNSCLCVLNSAWLSIVFARNASH